MPSPKPRRTSVRIADLHSKRSPVRDTAVAGSPKDLRDLTAELLDTEWFLDELNVPLQYAVRHDDVGCVAGHEEYFDIRTEGSDAIPQLATGHLGHHHVGENQPDFRAGLRAHAQGFLRAGRHHRCVSNALQRGRCHPAHELVIL